MRTSSFGGVRKTTQAIQKKNVCALKTCGRLVTVAVECVDYIERSCGSKPLPREIHSRLPCTIFH